MRSRPRRSLTALAATAALIGFYAHPASAQLQLEFKGGVLGGPLNLAVTGGSPGSGAVILPSFQTGPTPLTLVDPTDPRVLSVGIDLLPIASFGFVDAQGSTSATYNLPGAPALAGLTLYAQALTVPGAITIVDQISNRISFALGASGDVNSALSADVARRMWHTASPLKDGRVLALGGQVVAASPGTSFTAASSLFDPQTQTFSQAGIDLPTPRARHRTVELDDGTLLVVGGITAAGVTGQTTIVDPSSGVVQQAPPLNQPRVMFTATKLGDGRVLVVGGSQSFAVTHPIGFPASTSSAIASTELYDPLSGTWSFGPSLPAATTMSDAILLGSGKVLIIGGVRTIAGQGPVMSNACFLFDPSNDSLTPTNNLPRGRIHTGNARAASGDGIIAGGSTIDFVTQATTVFNDAFRFDQTLEVWSGLPNTPSPMRCGHIICVPDGQGGFYYIYGNGLRSLDLATGNAVYERNVYRLNGTLTAWSLVGTLSQDQMGSAMVAIDEGARTLFHGPGQGLLPVDTPTSEILIQ